MVKKKVNLRLMYDNLEKNKEHLTSRAKWELFQKSNPDLNLPTSQDIIRFYGTWNKVRKEFNVPHIKDDKKHTQFNKNDVNELLLKYLENLKSPSDWDFFVRNNSELLLPNSNTILRTFRTWNNMRKELGIPTTVRLSGKSKEEVLAMLKPYQEQLTTMKEWNEFIADNLYHLPNSNTIKNFFGAWTKMKNELKEYNQIN